MLANCYRWKLPALPPPPRNYELLMSKHWTVTLNNTQEAFPGLWEVGGGSVKMGGSYQALPWSCTPVVFLGLRNAPLERKTQFKNSEVLNS